MTMGNIRYWESVNPNLSSSLIDDERKQLSTVDDVAKSFDFSLLDVFSQSGNYSQSLYSDSFFGYDLNSSRGLRDATKKAKEMGMEKVLAAQLASPLPSYGSNDNRNSYGQNKSYDSLNNLANLTIQLQMARVHKVMDRLHQSRTLSLDEFIKSIDGR